MPPPEPLRPGDRLRMYLQALEHIGFDHEACMTRALYFAERLCADMDCGSVYRQSQPLLDAATLLAAVMREYAERASGGQG